MRFLEKEIVFGNHNTHYSREKDVGRWGRHSARARAKTTEGENARNFFISTVIAVEAHLSSKD